MRIAIANQKGGVGKTTLAVNLALGLSRKRGDSVLLIDLDPQANASMDFGIQEPALSAYDVLCEDTPIVDVIQNVGLRLDLLPGSLDLAAADVSLLTRIGGQVRLRSRLAEARLEYEWVIIDTPPALGLLTINALAASDRVIVPVVPGAYSLKGLNELSKTVDRVRTDLGCKGLRLYAVVLNMADHTTACALARTELQARFGELLAKTEIPRTVRLEEAHREGGIFEHDPSGRGAEAFAELLEELTHE